MCSPVGDHATDGDRRKGGWPAPPLETIDALQGVHAAGMASHILFSSKDCSSRAVANTHGHVGELGCRSKSHSSSNTRCRRHDKNSSRTNLAMNISIRRLRGAGCFRKTYPMLPPRQTQHLLCSERSTFTSLSTRSEVRHRSKGILRPQPNGLKGLYIRRRVIAENRRWVVLPLAQRLSLSHQAEYRQCVLPQG